MQSPLKILFVDDHLGLRDGMIQMLKNKDASFDFIGASDYESALAVLNENAGIEIVILDLNLDGRSGLEIIPEIKKISDEIAILIYTMFNDVIHIENALLNGVQGYITKDATIEELAVAIKTIANGNSYFNKAATEMMHTMLNNRSFSHNISNDVSYLFDCYKELSSKEREIFILLSQDMNVTDIAKKLNKSEKTVINQRTSVYQKLDITDRHDLFEKAKLLGLIL